MLIYIQLKYEYLRLLNKDILTEEKLHSCRPLIDTNSM